jgi:hypothetical protein
MSGRYPGNVASCLLTLTMAITSAYKLTLGDLIGFQRGRAKPCTGAAEHRLECDGDAQQSVVVSMLSYQLKPDGHSLSIEADRQRQCA